MLQKYLFSESELQTPREIIFASSPLGKLRSVIPLEELSKQLPQKKFPQGAKCWLDRSGMLALLFLKAYTGLSDASLIEYLNGNWQMQLFCGISLQNMSRSAMRPWFRASARKWPNIWTWNSFNRSCLTPGSPT